jgi:hypothetical protein
MSIGVENIDPHRRPDAERVEAESQLGREGSLVYRGAWARAALGPTSGEFFWPTRASFVCRLLCSSRDRLN